MSQEIMLYRGTNKGTVSFDFVRNGSVRRLEIDIGPKMAKHVETCLRGHEQADGIFFEGAYQRGRVRFLSMRVEDMPGAIDHIVEIPVDEVTVRNIMAEFQKVRPSLPKFVERGNDDPSI